MNEVTVHRGRNVQLAGIECAVDNEFLTDAVVQVLYLG
jgi:NAD kinase